MRTELSNAAVRVTLLVRHTIRNRPLDEELVLRQARALLLEPPRGCSLDEQYGGLVEALASPAEVSTFAGDPRAERPISEEEFRGHLRRVMAALDRMRPWTPPVLRALDDELWAHYVRPRAVGRILLDSYEIPSRIPYVFDFDRTPAGEVHVYIVLRLRSGRDVALAAPWWTRDEDSTAVLTLDRRVPAAVVMAELTAGSHFEPGEWQVLR